MKLLSDIADYIFLKKYGVKNVFKGKYDPDYDFFICRIIDTYGNGCFENSSDPDDLSVNVFQKTIGKLEKGEAKKLLTIRVDSNLKFNGNDSFLGNVDIFLNDIELVGSGIGGIKNETLHYNGRPSISTMRYYIEHVLEPLKKKKTIRLGEIGLMLCFNAPDQIMN